MKLKSILTKMLCVSLTFSLLFSTNISVISAEELSNEARKAQLEERIKESEAQIKKLKAESKETQEYLNALNTKISYLTEQYDMVSDEVDAVKTKISNLQTQYEDNEKSIEKTKEEIETLTEKYNESMSEFNVTYSEYCQRLRAMYVSGDMNVVSFLITSNDISQLLTRYQMIKSVSKQDSDILATLKEEMSSIEETQDSLVKSNELLENQQADLISTKEELEESIPELEEKQEQLDLKKDELSDQQKEANTLLKKINDKTGQYTEYIKTDRQEIAEIDDAIAAAAEKYKPVTTTTTTTTTKPTTTTTTTTKPNGSTSHTTTTTTTTTISTTSPSSSKYINLTYPVPSQTTITCGFGQYSGHTGADFSCAENSRVVAAESGTVIVSADLTNADGTYRSYGRYIVIMHDKTTSSGDYVYTLYAHNNTRVVSAGTHVTKGQLIAYSGSTGNSTGPHCHFEVRTPTSAYADCKNPALYL